VNSPLSPRFLSRLVNRAVGSGPWRAAPFDEIARGRLNYFAHGVHRAEDLAGRRIAPTPAPVVYGPAHALLGQTPTWESLDAGLRYRESGVFFPAALSLYSLSDACVATTDGVVYCPRTRTAIAETLRQWTQPALAHPLLSAPRYPAPVLLPGCTLSLLTLSGEGFYHLLLEAIPRLHPAADLLPTVDHILVNGSPGGFHEKWLALAGVPAAKIIWARGLAHFRCEQLLFTDYPMRDQQPSPATLADLRTRLGHVPVAHPGRRIWISRTDAAVRRISWETEFIARLPGFVPVVLSALAPAEQIALFADCAAVAGPHGAGLAHVAFCPPGAHLFELFPHERRQPIYHRLAGLAGAHYHWATVDFENPSKLDELAAAIARVLPPFAP
jgi:hypothetical protein